MGAYPIPVKKVRLVDQDAARNFRRNMTHEIELYFGGSETEAPYITITPVCFATQTELENYAYSEMRKQGAQAVSFGPIVPRDNNGKPV